MNINELELIQDIYESGGGGGGVKVFWSKVRNLTILCRVA